MFNITKIQGWISAGGYFVLFGLLFACGLGLPLPEDIPLIAAGALVANGKMNLLVAAIAAWLGIIGGDCVLYTMGKKFGLEITRVPFIGHHLTKARIQRVQLLFEKYGVGVVFIGRMFAGIRGAMVVAAGAIRYNFATFIVADGLGAVVSGGFFMFVGHWLGKNLTEEKIIRFKHFFAAGGIVAAAIFIGWILWRRRHRPVVDHVIKALGAEPPPLASGQNLTVDAPRSAAYASDRQVDSTRPDIHPITKEPSMSAVTVQPLAYPFDALEPYIDKQTMEIHHGKHYAAYVTNYNKALEKAPQLVGKPLHEVLANNLALVPEEIKTAVRNNGGGAHNHSLFWQIIGPKAGGSPVGKLGEAITSTFGGFDNFKEKFNTAATTRFGSGWAWLIKRGAKIEVISLPNQDSPIMEGAFPIIGLDVWEHAYYLKYQNRRPEYIAAWWNIVNWKEADTRFGRAM
jgi:Fe-Mn family superoxide dismutase